MASFLIFCHRIFWNNFPDSQHEMLLRIHESYLQMLVTKMEVKPWWSNDYWDIINSAGIIRICTQIVGYIWHR